jgi:hypothetical protein
VRFQVRTWVVSALLLAIGATAPAQQVSDSRESTPRVVQPALIRPGSSPFHLKAIVTEGRDPTPVARIEMFWVSPDKWRRTIESGDFSQTLIVSGSEVFEQDSDDYFPIELHALVTAMVDPKPILDAHTSAYRLLTKANGRSDESGTICFQDNNKMCAHSPFGLAEIVGTPGHSVEFTSYQDFDGRRVARVLVDTVGVGESLKAEVTELKKLKNPDDSLFLIAEPTPKEKQIRSVILPEAEFRNFAVEMYDIIWPQVLDGRTTGTASFYVSMDGSGKVREVLPVYTDNERSNDSARAQIMRWKFKPVVQDGFPAQAESVLTFALNTRAFGPPAPLSDAEVRKLASNIVDPMIPPGTAPSGTTYTLMAAIDSDGNLIEVIPAGGPPGLFQPCYQAIRLWHFNPILEDGQARPYRAEIKFQVP